MPSQPPKYDTIIKYTIALIYVPSLHSWIQPDEMNLNVGEVIEVIRKEDDGWWLGRKTQTDPANADTRSLWFPSNFTVEPEGVDLSRKGTIIDVVVSHLLHTLFNFRQTIEIHEDTIPICCQGTR